MQNHTEINTDRLTIKAKETTTLKGATANINHLALDTKNLHIESVQDIEKYDSKQTQGGVNASVAIYGSGSSVSAQGSRTKANVDYAQVTQQSGFNIKENSTINVAENTHLKGGIINAEGKKENHRLTTGTLTTESIENRSDIKVSTISTGVSSDMTQMATMAVGAALSALGNMNESERSQTKSAISQNVKVQITDSEAQKQKTGKTAEDTLQSLNRDVANANQKLDKQDLTKAQERQEMAQTIGQISEDWLQFAVGDKLKEADKKRQEADAIEKDNPTKSAELKAQAQAIEAKYGLGSNLQMGVRAATAALQGLATGSVNQAAVGAASPYLNKLIKEQTGDNKEANLIAHAVLGAVEAHFTGNNAAAGAVGALTAEAAAPLIMQTLYGTDNPTNLSDSQKQNVANLSQIAAGLSGGLVGDSTASSIAGAEIGKRAVEDNHFADDIHPSEDRKQTIEVMAKAMFKGDLQAAEEYYDKHQKEIAKYQLQEYLAIILTKGIPQIATQSTIVSGILGGGSETIGQLIDHKGDLSQIDGVKVGISTATSIVTKDMGIGKTALVNSGVEILDSYRTGEDPLTKGISSAVVTTTGGIIGKGVEIPLNNKINPNWRNYTEIKSSFSNAISSFYTPSSIPSVSGNVVDNIFSKSLEKTVEDKVEQYKEKVKENEK